MLAMKWKRYPETTPKGPAIAQQYVKILALAPLWLILLITDGSARRVTKRYPRFQIPRYWYHYNTNDSR